jgi:hypothetical protein
MVRITKKLLDKHFGKGSFVIVGSPEQVTEEECVFDCIFCEKKVHVHPRTVGYARVDFVKKHPEHKKYKTIFVCGKCHLDVIRYMKKKGNDDDLKLEFPPDALEMFGMTEEQMLELTKKMFNSLAS